MQGEELKLAAVGDCQISTRHSKCRDEAFLGAVELIRGADVAYANLEHLIHNYGPECYPVYKTGGTFTRAPPYAVEEFKWMGFDILSAATNHAFDYMIGGIKETMHNLKTGELEYAGIGLNLAEARAPAFVETAQGRVGLISVAVGTDLTWSATDARRDMKGKPGLNSIRVVKEHELDSETFKDLIKLVTKLNPLGLGQDYSSIPNDITSLEIPIGVAGTRGVLTTRFVLGDEIEAGSIGHEKDIQGNLQMVDDARRQADWVFVACHHHLTDGLHRNLPSKTVENFARACIDTGADGFIGTGPHQIQGIEIYKGRPIFYGIPDFIQQRSLVKKDPQIFYEELGLGFENTPMDAMDERSKGFFARLYSDPVHAESGIVVSKFKEHEVVDIKLYPVDLGFKKPRWQFGRPKLADGELAERIITRWAKLSEPYGTKIDFKDCVGVVKIS